jgi:subtilisin-like proprotein convertase family protein
MADEGTPKRRSRSFRRADAVGWRSLRILVPALLLLLLSVSAEAQQSQPTPPRVVTGARVMPAVTPTVKEIDLRFAIRRSLWRRGDGVRYIPKRFHATPKLEASQRQARKKMPRKSVDPLATLQRSFPERRAFSTPNLNVAGIAFTGAVPPDPVLDVGPTYVIQSVNTSGGSGFNIYNKSDGSLAAGSLSMSTLAAIGTDCASGAGDPIVLYDELAGRWMLSEFSGFGNKLCVYVSITADPIAGGWYAYQFQAPDFPDYPKYGVWSDGYYVGTNETAGPGLYVMDRAKMLTGAAATLQSFSVSSLSGFGFQMLTPVDHDGTTAPPAGSPGMFVRHRDDESHNAGSANGSQDFLEVYEISIDWDNAASSQLTGPISLAVTEFDSDLCGLSTFSCMPQPSGGTPLDPLREVVMWRAQYRNMSSHESIVGSLVTDINGSDHAGVRWFELRRLSGGTWTLHQEGTYSPDAHNRWMSSAAMDRAGNIAVAYSVGSSTLNAGLRYTGRLAGDPAGVMSQGETLIEAGLGQQGNERWGDYSSLSVDPSDGCSFWYTNETVLANGNWATRLASFDFDACQGSTISLAGTGLSQSVCAPNDLTPINISVTGLGGLTEDVSLALNELPAGFSGVFSVNPVTPGGSSILEMSVSGSADAGAQVFQIVGSAVDVDDKTLSASVNVYTTTLAGEAPDLISPANGSTVAGTTPTLTWTAVSQVDTYTLEIDDDPNFGSINYSWSGSGTSHTVTSALLGGTGYSWRVRVTNACGADTSAEWTFTVDAPANYCRTPNLAIPDATGARLDDLLSISELRSIGDLEVALDITHTWVGDLVVRLTHVESNTVVTLLDRPGTTDPLSGFGCDGDDIDATLSDAAASAVEEACAVASPAISGSFRPNELLSAFDGEPIWGTWQLTVDDAIESDAGQLVSWCLEPTLVPEPGAGLMLMSGILLMVAEQRRRRGRSRSVS